MNRPFELSRRVLGGVFLGGALAMVGAGLSVLRERLVGVAFLAYWLVCYLFTVLAIGMALLEAMAIRRRARRERQELLHRTLAGLGRVPDNGTGTQPGPDSSRR